MHVPSSIPRCNFHAARQWKRQWKRLNTVKFQLLQIILSTTSPTFLEHGTVERKGSCRHRGQCRYRGRHFPPTGGKRDDSDWLREKHSQDRRNTLTIRSMRCASSTCALLLHVIMLSFPLTLRDQSLSQELAASHCPGKLISTKCDVRNEDDIKDMFKMARTQFGGVDVCVNNAGLAHNAPLLTGGTDHWRDMLEVCAR